LGVASARSRPSRGATRRSSTPPRRRRPIVRGSQFSSARAATRRKNFVRGLLTLHRSERMIMENTGSIPRVLSWSWFQSHSVMDYRQCRQVRNESLNRACLAMCGTVPTLLENADGRARHAASRRTRAKRARQHAQSGVLGVTKAWMSAPPPAGFPHFSPNFPVLDKSRNGESSPTGSHVRDLLPRILHFGAQPADGCRSDFIQSEIRNPKSAIEDGFRKYSQNFPFRSKARVRGHPVFIPHSALRIEHFPQIPGSLTSRFQSVSQTRA
jgi:hypothetical protein